MRQQDRTHSTRAQAAERHAAALRHTQGLLHSVRRALELGGHEHRGLLHRILRIESVVATLDDRLADRRN